MSMYATVIMVCPRVVCNNECEKHDGRVPALCFAALRTSSRAASAHDLDGHPSIIDLRNKTTQSKTHHTNSYMLLLLLLLLLSVLLLLVS